MTFNSPVTVTIVFDVSELTPQQRAALHFYLRNETSQQFELVPGAICSVIQNPPGTFTAICTAELPHFSDYAAVFPADSDMDVNNLATGPLATALDALGG